MRVIHVVGARPNFMKAAPVVRVLSNLDGFEQRVIHAGQHYDADMSDVFFRQLGLPTPDINLEVGSGTHAVQTAQIMIHLEKVLLKHKPDLVLVYGDVNSTVAAALVCAKLLIPVGHVEAGLRSFDRTMPEEINRILTDQIADLLFTHSSEANDNLLREGVPEEKIYLVGNVMIDTVVQLMREAEERTVGTVDSPEKYALLTLHRPSNVDNPETLTRIFAALQEISALLPVIFPIHPRTRKQLVACGVRVSGNGRFNLVDPLGYLEFLFLQKNATLVITDSGGVQEETTFLGIPCLTVRENTERPITVRLGTNILVGNDMERLKREIYRILEGEGKKGTVPLLWDGKASERIADAIVRWGSTGL